MNLKRLRPHKLRLLIDHDGEARIWSHWQNLSPKNKRSTSGRWWLHVPGNCIGIEWYLFRRRFALSVEIQDRVSDNAELKFHIAIPFLLSLYFSIQNVGWLVRLFGLEYYDGQPMRDQSRALAISWHHGAFWIDPWVNPDDFDRTKRHTFQINPANILLGRAKYSESGRQKQDGFVVMPEGKYPATISIYWASWPRPRWPFTKQILRVEVDVPGGIPIPGKGDNDWDMDDDCIDSLVTSAETVPDALTKAARGIVDLRIRYHSASWKPAAGWPDHLIPTAAAEGEASTEGDRDERGRIFFEPGDDTEFNFDTPCPHCGHAYTLTRPCDVLGCEQGYIDLYEDDPLLFDPGDTETCSECHGTGYYHWCPNCGRDVRQGNDEE